MLITSPKRTVPPVARRPARLPLLRERLLVHSATVLNSLVGCRGEERFGILMYHRVTERPPGVPEPTWNVDPRKFEEQLTGLLTRGYEPWPLRELIQNHGLGEKIPRQAFAITFDDGYESVYQNAWPILRRLQIPATIFLSTAYLDSNEPFPSDDWLAAGDLRVPPEAWRPLGTSQCREMQQSGLVELGAHTHTHADFRGRPEDLRQDLRQNLQELQERFGIEDATFAFPFGMVKEGFAGGTLSQVAKEVGLLCSLSTEPELITRSASPFHWGRFPAEQHDSAATLAAKLGGWTSALRGMKQAFRNRRPR